MPAATLAHLRARFDLATHSKTPAARLGVQPEKPDRTFGCRVARLGAVRGARMANKRSHRGRPVWPVRYVYFPWEEKKRRLKREVERAREARQRDEDRIRRFEEVQRRKRNWIKFTEIAEEYSERDGPVAPEKAAAERERACAMLEHDLLARNFEENGRSQVLFLFPGFTDRRMTPQRLQDAIDYNYDNRCGRSYLENCWITRNRYELWREWHNLGELPPRFRPQKSQNASRRRAVMT